jgi:hypothetical protein
MFACSPNFRFTDGAAMNTFSLSPHILIGGLFVAVAMSLGAGCSSHDAPPSSVSSANVRVPEERPSKVEPSAHEENVPQPLGSQLDQASPLEPEEAPADEQQPLQFASNVRPPAQPVASADPAVTSNRPPLFKDWPTPQFALFLTGRQHGYIEPCGCTGLTNQKGGLARRHSLQQQLAKQGWPLIALDVGNQVRRVGRQAEIKFQITVEGLKQIGYRAIALGPDDLRLSVDELVAATVSPDEDHPSNFVCANAAVLAPEFTPQYKIVSVAGKKVGITAVLGSDEQKNVTADEIVLTPPADGLRAVWPKLKEENCDLYVLLAHASIDESKQLAQQFPDFDVVVTAGGAGEPTFEPEKIPGCKSILVQVGTKGMYVGVIGVFDDATDRLRYQRVPLDDRFPDSPDMLALLASYQDQLKEAGFEGLELRPIPHPSGRTFVGAQVCGECHTTAYSVWEKTPHAHALDSLTQPGERSEIPRHYDPECVSCHVTGWNPQKYYPYKSGYLSLKDTPLMHHNGCENCHGPGSAHVAAESGEGNLDQAAIDMLRASMRLSLEEAKTSKCMECHDLDNSPDFHKPGAFDQYWMQVEHYGRD